ncbi:MAG: hypothetical protein CL489_00010 [Acidobacteria bacterium]|nr:hypothetical protein [Acidobacteriota bacterium]
MEKIKGKSFWEKYTLPAIGTLMGGGLVAALHYDKKSRDKGLADVKEYQRLGEEKSQLLKDKRDTREEKIRQEEAQRVYKINQGLEPRDRSAAVAPPLITGDTNMANASDLYGVANIPYNPKPYDPFEGSKPPHWMSDPTGSSRSPYTGQDYPFKTEDKGSFLDKAIGSILPGLTKGGGNVFHNILAKAVPYVLEEGIPGVVKPAFSENAQLNTRDELFEQAQKSLADILPLTKAQMYGQHFPGLSQFENQLDAQTDATMQQLSASGRRGNVTPEVLMSMRQDLDEAKQGQVANFMLGSMQQAQQAYPKFIGYLSELSEQAGRMATEEEQYRADLAETLASLFLDNDPRLNGFAEIFERGTEEQKERIANILENIG